MSGLLFESLDYLYVPTADVDAAARRYVDELGAELVFKVRGMGTTVACLRVAATGPAILLSGHLDGEVPILVYRVRDYADTLERLRQSGIKEVHGSRSRTGRARASTSRTGSGSRSTSSCARRRLRASTAASTTDRRRSTVGR